MPLPKNHQNPNLEAARQKWVEKQNSETWFPARIIWLFCNVYNYPNQVLANRLGLKLTTVRNKIYELGLQRIEKVPPWAPEMTSALKKMYKTKGDVEIASILTYLYANRPFTKKNICKKRQLLNLHRTEEEVFKIASANASPGGRSFTILKNSCSENLHDNWVVQQIAWRDKDLQGEIKNNYPELISAYKTMLKLRRSLKEKENGKTKKCSS